MPHATAALPERFYRPLHFAVWEEQAAKQPPILGALARAKLDDLEGKMNRVKALADLVIGVGAEEPADPTVLSILLEEIGELQELLLLPICWGPEVLAVLRGEAEGPRRRGR